MTSRCLSDRPREPLVHARFEFVTDGARFRRFGANVDQEVGERAVRIRIERRVEGRRGGAELQDVLDVVDALAGEMRDVLHPHFVARVLEFHLEMALGADHVLQFAHDVHRQADRPGLVDHGTLDGLTDPPGGVGREAEAALRIELLQRVDQAEVPLLDEVEQRQAPVGVMLGNRHDEPQVALDHRLARREVAGQRAHGRVVLFLRRHQAVGADGGQVALDVVGVGKVERDGGVRRLRRRGLELALRISGFAARSSRRRCPPPVRQRAVRPAHREGARCGETSLQSKTSTWRKVFDRIERLALVTYLKVKLRAIAVRSPQFRDLLTACTCWPCETRIFLLWPYAVT